MKRFDKLITIQKIDEMSETWQDLFKVHAFINKAKADSEYLKAGATQDKISLIFEVRYFKDLQEIFGNTQIYRIIYQDKPFNIIDYDDYLFSHSTIKLIGQSNG